MWLFSLTNLVTIYFILNILKFILVKQKNIKFTIEEQPLIIIYMQLSIVKVVPKKESRAKDQVHNLNPITSVIVPSMWCNQIVTIQDNGNFRNISSTHCHIMKSFTSRSLKNQCMA